MNELKPSMWNYWSIDVPGLNESGADRLAEAARSLPGVVTAVPVDPKKWFTQHLDVESVQFIVMVVEVAVSSGELSEERYAQASSLLEDCRQWLREIGEVDNP